MSVGPNDLDRFMNNGTAQQIKNQFMRTGMGPSRGPLCNRNNVITPPNKDGPLKSTFSQRKPSTADPNQPGGGRKNYRI